MCERARARGLISFLAPAGSFPPPGGQNFEADKGGTSAGRRNKPGGSLDKISSDALPSFGLCVCNLLFRCHPPTVLFNAVWCRNIKYLSNPWTTSLSQFSLVWVFKNTHADWPTSNKNAFKGVGEGGGIGGVASVRAHQSLRVCAALARWGFQMARSAN